MSNAFATSITIRFVLNKADGGKFPAIRDFSSTEIADLRQCLVFSLDIDPSSVSSPWKLKILEVVFLYDGITPIQGEDFGYRLQAGKDRLQGYPAPILRFLMDRPVSPSCCAGYWAVLGSD